MRSTTLRETRQAREGTPFDARFFERDARFEPIVAVASLFADYKDWPSPSELDAALSARAKIRFVLATPRPRRHRGPVVLEEMYDARITRGEVPTRARHWHDFLNALVWATFPLAKKALHTRQHAALRAWVKPTTTPSLVTLPNARTRELDALALIDEGGVLVCTDKTILFGHALYEGLVLGTPAMIARSVVIDRDSREADACLAARLAPENELVPEHLPRCPL